MVHHDANVRRVRPILGAALLAVTLSACKQDVAFTQMAPAATPEESNPQTTTTVFAAVPIDLAAIRAEIEREVPEKLGRVVKWIENAACDRRSTGYECNSARVDGEIVRKGPVSLTATPAGRLAIAIPLGYDVSARGLGWAAAITEKKSGDVTVTLELETGLGSDYSADARTLPDATWSVRGTAILKGQLDLVKEIEPKLQRAVLAASASVKRTLAQLPLKDATARVWAQLLQPMELISNRRMWLRGEPERIYAGGFGQTGDAVTYRVAIQGKIGVWADGRPAPLLARPMPQPLRGQAGGQAAVPKTRLRIPFYIDLDTVFAAIRAQFPDKEVIETRADNLSTPIKVRVKDVTLFPSRQLVGMELSLDVVSPSNWLGLQGKAHLVGRAVVKPDGREIVLENIGFPMLMQRPAKPQQKTVRIGEQPFAKRLETAFKIDVARLVDEAKRQAGSAFDQAVADGVAMTGGFDAVTIGGITPVRDGLMLTVDLDGALTFKVDPDALRTSGSLTTTSAAATVETGPAVKAKK